jgi:hypothetical protein
MFHKKIEQESAKILRASLTDRMDLVKERSPATKQSGREYRKLANQHNRVLLRGRR